jgi:aminoglycoside phosphotransferase (APT) family kinase protein
MENDQVTKRLSEIWCARIAGFVAIRDLRRLTAGAVNETWAFDVCTDEGLTKPFVLRRAAGGVRTTRGAISIEAEAQLIAAAGRRGVPVAAPRYVLRPSDGLGEGFISDRLDGETLGGRIANSPRLAQAREGLAFCCGEVLASIHAIGTTEAGGLEIRTPATGLEELQSRYDRTATARPVFVLALNWLNAHTPSERPLTVVHGDFRNGNIIVTDQGLRAVLDWEGAHISDPMSDLGYLCVPSWRFGRVEKPVGGFGDREELLAGYEAGGGRAERDALKFWEVYGVLRWGMICSEQSRAFSEGGGVNVEAAVIARRASETELDLLALLAPSLP